MPNPSLEGIVAWSEGEIALNIKALLPPGWEFLMGDEGALLKAAIVEGETEIRWEDTGYDRRILLLNAYGWLYRRVRPQSSHPAWHREREDFRVPVKAPSGGGALPEDLDPVAIAELYANQQKTRR